MTTEQEIVNNIKLNYIMKAVDKYASAVSMLDQAYNTIDKYSIHPNIIQRERDAKNELLSIIKKALET